MKTKLILTAAAASLLLLGACKSTPEAPESADKVVTFAAEAIQKNEPGKLYVLMPESYQKDVKAVAAEWSKLDAAYFEKANKIYGLALSILDKHGEEIGKLIPKEAGFTLDDVKKYAKMVKETGVLDQDKLADLDVQEILSEQGPALMEALRTAAKNDADVAEGLKSAEGVEATVKETEGDVAQVEITADGETEVVPFKKVEGKWIPAPVAEMWPAQMKQAKEEAAKQVAQLNENKEAMLKQMDGVIAMLQGIEKEGNVADAMKSLPL